MTSRRGSAGATRAAIGLAAALLWSATPVAARPTPAGELEAAGWARLAESAPAAADSLFAQALRRRGAGGESARSLAGLAEARRVLRRPAEADSLAQLALAALPALAAPDPALEARIRETLASLLLDRREVGPALVEIERAIALAASAPPVDSVVLARRGIARGRLLVLQGRPGEAQRQFEEVARLHERLFGGDSPELAQTLYLAYFAASEVGDYLAGLRHAERSVAVRQRALGPEHPLVAVSLMGLGGARRDLGDLDGALAAMDRAEAIQRAARPPNPAALATTLSNRGGIHLMRGEGTTARACYEEAIALRDQAFGTGRGEDLFVAGRVAMALLLEGDAVAARARVERALERSAQVDPLVTPGALVVHASAAYRLGDRAAARASLERSLALSDSLRGPGSPRTLETQGQLAALDYEDGRRESALRRALFIEEHSRALLAQAADVLAEREALDLASIRESGLSVLVALAADSGGLAPAERRRVFDAVIRARMLVLDRRAEERHALHLDDAGLGDQVRELEAAREALARLQVAAALGDGADSTAVADAVRRREAAERALGERSAAYRGARERIDAGFDAVAAHLPAGWALAGFVRLPPPTVELIDLARRDPAEARDFALVLRGAGAARAPTVVALGRAGRIDARVDRWLAALSRRPTLAAEERRCAGLGRAVAQVLWEPLQAAIGGADTVAFVPDGALHRVDFAALPGRGEGTYLVERGPLFVRLTTERDLVPAPEAGPTRGLLALGGVDFEARPAGAGDLLAGGAATRATATGTPRLRFAPLPGTAAEVAAIARAWDGSASGARSPARLLTAAAASEEAFKHEAPGSRILHLATHGFALDVADTMRAGVLAATTRGIGGLAAGSPPAAAPSRRMPLVPGLALAGANRVPVPGGEDGFLTAEEISALDLTGTEWAVLSACETGLADPAAVEAVQGLHRAFRRAGVRTVVMSLWSVDDASTAAWMEALYRARLADGRLTAGAVQAAHRARLAARRAARESTHPFWWAGFIASGAAR